MTRSRLFLEIAGVLALIAGAVVAGQSIVTATGRGSVTASYSIDVGGMTRGYDTIVPVAPLPASAPVIVVLGGISATRQVEIARDRLVPYVNDGRAELVYPDGYHESWNAVGCCGDAGKKKVDDIAFIKALAARADPGHTHPLDVVGYSNGGRMAYRMECADPGIFDQMAIVKADPEPGCAVTRPRSILQIAALDDTAVPYRPGEKGKETPPAIVQSARLRAVGRCGAGTTSSRPGRTLQYTVWDDCADGTRVGFAVYSVGGHNFPPPSATQPSAGTVIWAFFNHRSHVALK